ncbi:TPA: hypothetical protein HA281_06010 [Candidatus Woesearchaeota archaeon]|nr:hypothetical protein [Candidatus Woesearchaeota archaeon]HIH92325.1 hypothetical protein [Candidatus Woesearchaeota archaeon]HIJ18826.1 hypothetical protein [Candidatus Woesearchaeota archaeon]
MIKGYGIGDLVILQKLGVSYEKGRIMQETRDGTRQQLSPDSLDSLLTGFKQLPEPAVANGFGASDYMNFIRGMPELGLRRGGGAYLGKTGDGALDPASVLDMLKRYSECMDSIEVAKSHSSKGKNEVYNPANAAPHVEKALGLASALGIDVKDRVAFLYPEIADAYFQLAADALDPPLLKGDKPYHKDPHRAFDYLQKAEKYWGKGDGNRKGVARSLYCKIHSTAAELAEHHRGGNGSLDTPYDALVLASAAMVRAAPTGSQSAPKKSRVSDGRRSPCLVKNR